MWMRVKKDGKEEEWSECRGTGRRTAGKGRGHGH